MIIIGGRDLNLDDFYKILFKNEKVELDSNALKNVKENFEFLSDFSKNKVIYGINTCFGPMAQYKISDEDQIQLQLNLIRSHSSGSGNTLPGVYVKSLMIARLNTLMKAHSGIHPEVVVLIKELINRDIYPKIFEHGGVGASGDLVQLAHLALILIGEGEVFYNGKFRPTQEVFKENNLTPISIHLREGLALINGTSVMSGIGIINTIHAKNLINWSIAASSIINEIVESYDDHFSLELNQVKLHIGQNKVAEAMREALKSSKLVKKRSDHLYNYSSKADIIKEKVQEYYSLRCVPQILGIIYDTVKFTEEILIQEVNSVNDNPIVDSKNKDVFHGGNFHGDYVSFEMDKLKIAITKLSMLAERQLNFLLNDKINQKLPPFVNLGTLGLNLGMQGVQFTATSTTAENQTLSFPMYVHSIPNNNDNQDIVSMGTNSALITKKVIENTFEVLSIEFITILQAIDYLKINNRLSDFSTVLFDKMRTIVPIFIQDSIKYKDVENIKQYLITNQNCLIK